LHDPWWREVIKLAPAYRALSTYAGARRLLQTLAKYAGEIADAETQAVSLATVAGALLDLREYVRDHDLLAKTADEMRESLLQILDDPAQPGEPKARAEIAACLGQFSPRRPDEQSVWRGDPRLTDERRWVQVPAGRFRRGSSAPQSQADERPADWVNVSEFYLQRWPVTIASYHIFIQAEGYGRDRWWDEEGWKWLRSHPAKSAPGEWEWQTKKSPNCPVTGVSWWEARAYCRWYSTVAKGLPRGWVVRLPTEAEWEMAARGADSLNQSAPREYPWPGDWDDRRANSCDGNWLGGVSPVGCYPLGHGPYGAWDQAGNVWEWCLDYYDHQAYHRPRRDDPAVTDPQGVPRIAVLNDHNQQVQALCRVARGGSWTNDAAQCRVSARNRLEPSRRLDEVGFRCVAVPASRAFA
jgi:formylglycine-generating enzyme required for sulfatase activity